MKCLRKTVAVFLSVLMITALLTPSAFAEEANETQINWEEFYIKTQPKAPQNAKYGDDINLSVEVNAPEGVEISYQWWCYDPVVGIGDYEPCDSKTEAVIALKKGEVYYPKNTGEKGFTYNVFYKCIIKASQKDENGEIIDSRELATDFVSFKMEQGLSKKLEYLFVAPFGSALGATIMVLGLSYGVLVPLAPIIYIVMLPVAFVSNIKNFKDANKA